MLLRLQNVLSAPLIGFCLALFIGIGAMLVAVAEAQIISYTHPIYVVGENLLVVSSILGILYALLTRDQAVPGDAERPTKLPNAAIAIGVAAAGGIALFLLTNYLTELSVYDAAIGVLIAISLYIGVRALNRTSVPDAQVGVNDLSFIPLVIVVLLALICIVRLVASSSDLLTYILTPIAVFVLPGLALSLALLEADASPLARFALVPVLSIASQLIFVAWVLWLRIPVTPLLLLGGCVAITLVGLGAYVIPKRLARRTISLDSV